MNGKAPSHHHIPKHSRSIGRSCRWCRRMSLADVMHLDMRLMITITCGCTNAVDGKRIGGRRKRERKMEGRCHEGMEEGGNEVEGICWMVDVDRHVLDLIGIG